MTPVQYFKLRRPLIPAKTLVRQQARQASNCIVRRNFEQLETQIDQALSTLEELQGEIQVYRPSQPNKVSVR